MLFILDTCTLSYLEDPRSKFNTAVLTALGKLSDGDELSLSILTVYELEYGLKWAEATLAQDLNAAKRNALELYQVLPLSRKGSRIFADLKYRYREYQAKQMDGKELTKHLARHTVDLVIASTAIEHRARVVSNDRIFNILRRAHPELIVTDWTRADDSGASRADEVDY